MNARLLAVRESVWDAAANGRTIVDEFPITDAVDLGTRVMDAATIALAQGCVRLEVMVWS